MAIVATWNNNGVKSTIDVTPGTPHVAFIGAAASAIFPDQATLPNLAGHKHFLRREDGTMDTVVHGQPCDYDASTIKGCEMNVFLASWRAWSRQAMGMLFAVDKSGDPRINVIKCDVQAHMDYLHVNREFVTICALGEWSKGVWPPVEDCRR